MESKKSITLNGLVPINFLYLCLSFSMILIGVYLTNHYFNIHYPSGITGASTLCNINDFWGCDKATLSTFGTIAGMPTSIFGIVMGVIGIITVFKASEEVEKTTKTILLINLLACLILFIYSLISLHSLCPMCTAYYLISAISYFIFHKYSRLGFSINPKIAGFFLLLLIVPLIGTNFYIGKKEAAKNTLTKSYINQFKDLKDYGDPTVESDYKIYMSTQNFNEAPIRISVFSDFQCPYCKAVSEQLPELIKSFKGKINIQYMFYPLDPSCNKQMKGGLHAYACQAAYLAACDKEKFPKVHDTIFEKQEQINTENLKLWAKEYQLSETCFTDNKVQDKIQQTLNAGEQFNLRSTPTIIINGKKLEGLIPTQHLKSILQSLL